MYNNHGVQRYRETDINSMSKEKMIVLLYEKMQSDLMCAQKALRNDDRVEMTKKVNHSQRIVSELRGALDHSIGGEVSQNLDNLYDFMFHQHLEVLVDLNEVHLVNCLRVLEPLLQAWRQIPSGTAENAAREKTNPTTGPDPAQEKLTQNESTADQSGERTSILSVSA
jgi:flagellar secretion chaperone FliS